MNSKPDSVVRSPWLYDSKPFEMVPDLYYVGNRNVSAHLFDTGDGLLLLDTAYSQTAYLLTESIRELGLHPRDIKWILHSHGHYDHFGGTRLLAEKYGCRTYFPAKDLALLKEKRALNCAADAGLPYEPPYDLYFEPDVLVMPGAQLRFGSIAVDCFAAPGHTPGTMAYVFHLKSGLNAAMHGGIGRNTLRSEYLNRFQLGRQWRMAYVDTLRKLHGLKVDVVLGNHPEQAATFEKLERKTDSFNPFIDSSEWERFLARAYERYLEMEREDPME